MKKLFDKKFLIKDVLPMLLVTVLTVGVAVFNSPVAISDASDVVAAEETSDVAAADQSKDKKASAEDKKADDKADKAEAISTSSSSGSKSSGKSSGSSSGGSSKPTHTHTWVTGREDRNFGKVYVCVSSQSGSRCSACGTEYVGAGGADCTCCSAHGWASCVIPIYDWIDDIRTVEYVYCLGCGARK